MVHLVGAVLAPGHASGGSLAHRLVAVASAGTHWDRGWRGAGIHQGDFAFTSKNTGLSLTATATATATITLEPVL